jgi:hypothetical protein
LSLLACLRLAWLNAYPPNSDEAQHAHVAWSWTQNLLLYRDVFDNHGPLFSWLSSWVLRLTGERADVVTWLRLSMQLWYALALGSIWWMGRRLYGSNVAFAATLLAGLVPRFFLVSGQFRTDDLWAAAWLAALAMVVGAAPRGRRWFLAGLLAGAALSVSQKTMVLLAIALAAGLVVSLPRPRREPQPLWRYVICGLCGLLVLPAIFTAWLAWRDDLGPAWYCLVGYNVGEGVPKAHAGVKLAAFVLLGGAFAALAAWHVRRRAAASFDWPVFLALQAGLFLLLVWFVWPLITAQDFLPAIPPLVLVLCGSLSVSPWLRDRPGHLRALTVAALAVECLGLFASMPPWRDRLAPQRAELAAALHYADAKDSVMDPKGDTIFRQRPYYPVIESMAMYRMRCGLMQDTIADALVRHGTMLVVRRRLPPASDRFVAAHYLRAEGDIWMAGLPVPAGEGERIVDIAVPGDYTLSDGHVTAQAALDGGAPADHWTLSAGRHRLNPVGTQPLQLVWSQAWERGWRPAVSIVQPAVAQSTAVQPAVVQSAVVQSGVVAAGAPSFEPAESTAACH